MEEYRRGEPPNHSERKTFLRRATDMFLDTLAPYIGDSMTAIAKGWNKEVDKYALGLLAVKDHDKEEKLDAFEQDLKSLKLRFKKLNMRKDLLHFFMSLYPMDQMPDNIHCITVRKFKILFNHPIRTFEETLHKKNIQLVKEKQISPTTLDRVYSKLKNSAKLHNFPGEIRPYLPQGWTSECDKLVFLASDREFSPSDAVPDWAIKSAVIQALHFITNGLGQLLAISGDDAKKVAEQLAQTTELRKKFDVILFISLSQYHNNEEIRMSIEKEIQDFLEAEGALKYSKFLLILDGIDESYFDLYELKIPIDHGFIVLTTQSKDIYCKLAVDMEIKMEYQLLPWELFCKNVNQDVSTSSSFNEVARRLVEECHCNLFATILLSRALKNVEIDVWKQALEELMRPRSSSLEEAKTEVLIHVLKFIWKQKNLTTRRCIQHYIEYGKGEKTNADFMILCWLLGCLVETVEEGGEVVKDLIDSFLIERSQNGDLQMPKEVKKVLLERILPHYGLERMGTKIIERDAQLISLQNSELTELPESPEFFHLKKLILNGSDLLKIAPSFFEHMPMLHFLDLSNTSIMNLPSSISKLVLLEKLILKCCELLMELPPEIGQLQLLKVLDLDGTEIMYIPREIENLTRLEELRLSICGHGERFRRAKNIKRIYPKGVLSKLINLKELSIDVNPEDKQWSDEVGYIISNLMLIRLRSLKLYLPKVELLWVETLNLYLLPDFKLIVGQCEQRMISHIPQEVEKKFEEQTKSLRYINGESISNHLVNALKCCHAFLLDRHWNIKKLSEVGSANLKLLKFGLLVECNELETILDEDEFPKEDNKHELQFNERLGLLEYLSLYYLRNLTSICRGPVGMGTLSKLKHLRLRACTNLTQLFTFELLKNLENLEELVLEDCPKIKSLVTDKTSSTELGHFLPRLKKMYLLSLPELVSITNGICIAPELESLVVFYCPKLENISKKELTCKHLKVLKGEREWWDSLGWDDWDSDDQDDLAEIFVPIRRDGKLNAQLT